MRHGYAGNRLGRNSGLRKATVRDIAKATLIHQRICTTKAKAKEARKLVDKLITLGKKGTLAHKRQAFAVLCSHRLVKDLFDTISPRFVSRKGGYTRIIPLGLRRGDSAQLVYLELTEKAEVVVRKPKVSLVAKKISGEKKDAGKTEAADTDKKITPSRPVVQKEILKDKSKVDKKIGGIKKIFRRKTAE